MLTFKEYTKAIDVWSVGCILAEMLSGKPLFPGKDCEYSSAQGIHYQLLTSADHHQLTLILDVLGTPTMEDYYGIKSRRAREYIRSLPFKKKIPWKAMFPKTNDLALDLLERLLAFNPVKRITVEDALKHPYLEPYHDPDDEPTADPIPEEFFDFDKNKDNLTKEQLKRTYRLFFVCVRLLLIIQQSSSTRRLCGKCFEFPPCATYTRDTTIQSNFQNLSLQLAGLSSLPYERRFVPSPLILDLSQKHDSMKAMRT
jgi:serine/threonine protein kinase